MGRLEGVLEDVLEGVLKIVLVNMLDGMVLESRRYLECVSEGVLVDVLLARNNKCVLQSSLSRLD